jgi:RNA 2',3'-cyclic 3'-phosphodiesterase
LTVEGGGAFGRPRRPRVLFAAIRGDVGALAELQADLVRELTPLGYRSEHSSYEPHLTLARARHDRGDAPLGLCSEALASASLGESRVSELVLFRSETRPEGARHTALLRAPLR